MTSTTHKKRISIQISVCLLILCFVYLCNRVSGEAKTLNLRNATDSLMPLIELATESGDDYVLAKNNFLKILQDYTNHMKQRELNWLLQLPPFSGKNIVKELERVEKDLEDDDQNARKAIDAAAESIAGFLTKSNPFTDESIVTFEPEVISKRIQDIIRASLEEANKKTEIYANDPNNVDSSLAACMANRKAIVYLYLARFNYQEIIDQEDLRTFRTGINQTIYYNRILQKTKEVKDSKKQKDSLYDRLEKYSASEIRRLHLLQAIIDNDIQQAQVLLQIAIKKTFPTFNF